MNEVLVDTPLTAFDAIAIILILISGLMAFARGLIREVASLVAFVAGLAAAYFSWVYFGQWTRDQLPDGWHDWIADAGVVLVAFLSVYIVAAWFGARFSKLVHTATDIGILDRLAGLAFGGLRGAVVVMGFIIVMSMTLPTDSFPGWIRDARTYPMFERGADYLRTNAPGIAKSVEDALPETDQSTNQGEN